jgi:sialic acid synthase SpsE
MKIIAEFCQNHNGDPAILAEMIDAAAAAGATYGKIQTIYADDLVYRPQFEEGLVVGEITQSIKRPYRPEYERLRGLEISADQSRDFVRRCEAAHLIPMTTCFTRAHVGPLRDIGFKSIKVASYDCGSYPMLRELQSSFDEIIVSTGASFDDEIRHASETLDGSNFAFLHCVTIYPTPLSETHLDRMAFLRELSPRVGFSDHSLVRRDKIIAAKAATVLGAELVERHFTILPEDQTRDGPVSITPALLAELTAFASCTKDDQYAALDDEHPNWRETIGGRQRALSDAELLNRDYYRGRFGSTRPGYKPGTATVFNWEETPLAP